MFNASLLSSLSPPAMYVSRQAPPHIVISHSLSFSPSLSIYLYISLHRPYSFDIPWAIWIPGRDTTKALAHMRSRTRTGDRQRGPIDCTGHTGIRQKGNAGGTHSCAAQARCGSLGGTPAWREREQHRAPGGRGREPERESPSESPSESEPWHQFGCSRGHAKCFTPC